MSQPKRIVLGTAGHIDHGKTALVRALTGIDTDRLKEEQKRGITIELGFATLDLPAGQRLSIVDVPGHEKFVRNMVAGAAGIDTVLFIVAADEGVMPQTLEHLEICSLLGVKSGIVALTKVDMVDDEFVELVREEVTDLVEGTFLEGAPMVPVSAITGEGVDDLKEALAKLADSIESRDAKGLFRLPVDRVFTIKGFGTVVTGTLLSGAVKKDEEVEILPSGVRAKVRGVEVHGEAVNKAWAGNRTALNFSGVGVDEIHRGNTVIHPGAMEPTYMVDAAFRLLPTVGKPLEDRQKFRLHIATQEVPVTVALLEEDVMEAGEGGYVQLRSKEKFIACPGDHFVLRAYSPAKTVGGGRIIDHSPSRHKGRRASTVEALKVLDTGEALSRLEVFLMLRREKGLTPPEAQSALNVTLDEARSLLQKALNGGTALVVDRKTQHHVYTGFIEELAAEALEILAAFHKDNPLRRGLGIEELRSKYPRYLGAKLVVFTLEKLQEEGKVAVEGEFVRLSDFSATLSVEDGELREKLTGYIFERGYEAPTLENVAEALGEEAKALKPVLEYLVGEDIFVRTKEGFFFDKRVMDGFISKVIDLIAERGEVSVADIKELTGLTRKYTIPLLEYLDTNRITTRKGDVRVAGVRGKRQ